MNQSFRIFILLLLANVLSAQTAAVSLVGDPWAVTPAGEFYMAPSWSPDGQTISMHGSGYTGLYIIAVEGGTITTLADKLIFSPGSAWSKTSDKILATATRYENRRRYNAVLVFDAQTGKDHELTAFATGPTGAAFWADNGSAVDLFDRHNSYRRHRLPAGLNLAAPATEANAEYIVLQGEKVVRLTSQAPTATTIPTIEGQKLNLALSPDGTRMAFEIYGGNLWVAGVDGSEAVDLGPGNRPSWSPAGDKLTYIITEDDGHQIRSSDVYIINADGTGKVNITHSENILEMHPAWSPDGDRIAYDDLTTGRIFVQEVR